MVNGEHLLNLVLKTSDSGGTFKVSQSSIFTYLIWLGNDQDIIEKKLLLEILRKLHLSKIMKLFQQILRLLK